MLFEGTTHYLAGDAHRQAIAALDEFTAHHAETLIVDPVKRASLQRDLWAVFDWTTFHDDHPVERRALQQRLAPIIRALALSSEQIAALPAERPLTSALLHAEGGAVLAGRDDGPMGLVHTRAFPFLGRSVFLVFIRAPGGRDATLRLIDALNAHGSADVPQGTEVFLVRRALLIARGVSGSRRSSNRASGASSMRAASRRLPKPSSIANGSSGVRRKGCAN